ncbi:MAG: hypothetical protein JJU07_01595 [Natronohydrobacter sp.]|nr:hypothetical protein [Natronohydrobacter sp.]
MKSTVFQIAGVAVIILSVGVVWLLDLYGCAFNTMGCNRIMPRLTAELMTLLVVPVIVGTGLILYGRSLR